ncbi:FYVE-domain-containing protein [Annulohypoxylon maeteangense]|uniref:FYVE-domain-containing protein n=1 Tax=Annulohypoxylon maeteangense TaxID=1927788 RepID=UPI00200873D6|nr:FYVE-domain-containing protein [Annulohypoxylon maeteangense]KAI0890673.1 FYVE-domain-containing protein [Annulohypoxylon maeteangense]
MSTADNVTDAPGPSGEQIHAIRDAESESSYARSTDSSTPGCDSYYDCPTHRFPRNAVIDVSPNTSDAGRSDQSLPSEDSSSQVNGIAEDSASVEHPDVELSGEAITTPGQVPALDTELSSISGSSEEQANSEPTPVPARGMRGTSAAQEAGITLREALHQTVESLAELSISNEDTSHSTPDGRAELPDDASRNNIASTSNPPENQRPTSRLNPIAPPFSPRRSPQEVSLPRWQPDSEVTYCPICRTQFSFFVRKHHCRKCGRVVCNSCSPHKITIPHQYIVRPPGERNFHRYSFLGEEGSIADFSALGGGEQVRLCNPCVPDPNTTPPQTQHSTGQFSPRSPLPHHRSQSSSSGNYNYNGNHNSDNNVNRYPQYMIPPNMSPDTYSRSRSVTMHSGPGPSRATSSNYYPPQSRIISGTSPTYYPHPYSTYRHSSFLGHRFPGASLADLADMAGLGGPSSSSSAATMNRPLPPPPQIPEEDECPICHRELPSRELSNFEARRESHIESCIVAHSAYSPGSRSGSGPGSVGSSMPGSHGVPPLTARRTGMFPYLATEKDCVDSAECTICLEEFEVGVPMARLECLCRFHRSCITAWFVDHPGRCPVHQHDSFGY